jgi:signal transduction histidine kinase
LLTRALERGGFDIAAERVDTREAMERALASGRWDLILADHSMPQFSAPEALELMNGRGLDLPFIIVSGHIDEETAVSAMRAGAHDYVMKDRLARLAPAVERELREAEVRVAVRRSQKELQRAHEELELRVERRTADLKAANQKLEKVIEERRRLENELLEIAENERRRIGFDLHDDLGQKLTGAVLMVKALERRLTSEAHPGAAEARRIQQLIEEITHHTHNLAHQFSALDQQGDDLTTVLKGLAGNVENMFDIPCDFAIKGNIPALPQHTTTQLYKICQEAVSNSVKHGKAKRVVVALVRNAHELLVTIRNDGLPFSQPEKAKNRMGLRIMNYRANTIGAVLEIKSVPKGGTIVSCSLSIKTAARSRVQKPTAQQRAEPREAGHDLAQDSVIATAAF